MAVVVAQDRFKAAKVLSWELEAAEVAFACENLPYNMSEVGDADDSVVGVLHMLIPGVVL